MKFNAFMKKGVRPRRPLRTLKELSAEFGVSYQALSSSLGNMSGPDPIFQQQTASGHETYYDPADVRKWWESIHP